MIEVNLLPLINVLSQKEKQIRQNLTLFVVAVAVLIVVCQVLLFLINTIVGFQNSSQQKQRDDLLLVLKDNSYEAAVDLRIINNKISGLRQIKKTQTNFGKMMGDVLNMVSPNAVVKSFSLDTTGAVTLTTVSPDLLSFGTFMNKLTSTAPIPFKEIAISGIKEDGNSINFSLTMKHEAF